MYENYEDELYQEGRKLQIKYDEQKKIIDECLVTLRHATIFVSTREKMHPDGIKLFIELIHKIEEFNDRYQ